MDLSNLLANVAPQESNNNGEKKALPQGNYNVVIEKVEAKTNPTTGNKGINLQMKVFGMDKYNGAVVFDYMALTNQSEKVLQYSLPKLKKLGMLLGSEDATKWQGGKVVVNLSVDRKDDTRNMNWGFSEYVADDNTPIIHNTAQPVITANDLPF